MHSAANFFTLINWDLINLIHHHPSHTLLLAYCNFPPPPAYVFHSYFSDLILSRIFLINQKILLYITIKL